MCAFTIDLLLCVMNSVVIERQPNERKEINRDFNNSDKAVSDDSSSKLHPKGQHLIVVSLFRF